MCFPHEHAQCATWINYRRNFIAEQNGSWPFMSISANLVVEDGVPVIVLPEEDALLSDGQVGDPFVDIHSDSDELVKYLMTLRTKSKLCVCVCVCVCVFGIFSLMYNIVLYWHIFDSDFTIKISRYLFLHLRYAIAV